MHCARPITTTRAVVVAVLFSIAISTGGCGSTRPAASLSLATRPPPTKQSPEQATLAWFSAVDHKDKAEAVADFEPDRGGPDELGQR